MMQQPNLFADERSEIDNSTFPRTRYQGSKRRLISQLNAAFDLFKPGRAMDLYAGTATVSLLLQQKGWNTISNDYLKFNNATAGAVLGGHVHQLDDAEIIRDLTWLLSEAVLRSDCIVSREFAGIFFTDAENEQIDRFCQNIGAFSQDKREIYVYGVGQALLMKRPYNLFHRANLEMRTRDVKRSFGNAATWETPILQHAIKCVRELRKIPLSPNTHFEVSSVNTMDLEELPLNLDLIYLDPPYLNSRGASVDYVNFYHFLDGLVDYALFSESNSQFVHKPILQRKSAWVSKSGALDELSRILKKWRGVPVVMSYRTDGQPNLDDIDTVFKANGRSIYKIDTHEFKYALSKSNDTKELILISK